MKKTNKNYGCSVSDYKFYILLKGTVHKTYLQDSLEVCPSSWIITQTHAMLHAGRPVRKRI